MNDKIMDNFEEATENQILILGSSAAKEKSEVMRGSIVASKISEVTSVEVTNLQNQINIFLNQLDTVLSDTPEKVGKFSLTEFEVTAGIVIQGKGQVGIALLGALEVSGQANAGIKFVFKRA